MLVAIAFLAVSLTPAVLADHAYSHRYIVYGRVVDAENNPVAGLTVDLGVVKPFQPDGQCADQPGTETEAWGPTRARPITNQFGEFIFCYHIHSMSRSTPGGGIVRIDSLDYEKEVEFDGYMRYSFIPVKLDTVHPNANKTILDQFYTVQGRAWEDHGTNIKVETIRVYGDTVKYAPVNITIQPEGKDPITLNTTTNGYGDFAVRVPVESRLTSGTVTVEIEGRTFSAPIDGETGVTQFRADTPAPKDPFVTKFLIGLGVVAVVVVGGGGLWFASARMKTMRDERAAREGSSRKRANK